MPTRYERRTLCSDPESFPKVGPSESIITSLKLCSESELECCEATGPRVPSNAGPGVSPDPLEFIRDLLGAIGLGLPLVSAALRVTGKILC
jgi:hypothetical protein